MLNIVHTFNALAVRLRSDEKGASAVEYAILVGAVGSAVVAAVLAYRPLIIAMFTSIITKAST